MRMFVVEHSAEPSFLADNSVTNPDDGKSEANFQAAVITGIRVEATEKGVTIDKDGVPLILARSIVSLFEYWVRK